MKHFFTSACAKIGRFFWSWGFLKFCLWAVTLIILFYAEEDWRGARAWGATKAKWEAQGESFDFNKLISPPVPDDLNLAAIPLFKLEPAKPGYPAFEPIALQRALRVEPYDGSADLPHSGNWEGGKLPDIEKLRSGIATAYAKAFKTSPPPPDPLVQLDALYPFLADLRIASATRPYCHFQADYTFQDYAFPPPGSDPISFLGSQLHLSSLLNLHATLALQDHQSDLALDDIRLNFKLISGVKQGLPTLVGGLVAIGMTAIDFGAVYDGLALHAWNDAQLAELQEMLERNEFLSAYQLALRGEILAFTIPATDYLKHQRSKIPGLLKRGDNSAGSFMPSFIFSDGWLDQNKVQIVDAYMRSLHSFDPAKHLVSATTADEVEQRVQHDRKKFTGTAPWNIFYTVSTGSVLLAAPKFAQIQVWLDEAQIACALERYRLAHNAYPDSLDALVPACIDELPHDIMNGEPYHYHLRPDGTFLLYSVGWNQIDDGGKVVFQKDAPSLVDYKQGDWVWPTAQPYKR